MKERLISVSIAVLALAAFQPFGLPLFGWMRVVHLLALWILGVVSCGLSEVIVRLLGYHKSMDRGVQYVIRRNLTYQFVNTPLISLLICLYRHFVLNTTSYDNSLSWANYLETLIFMAFCSFVIGLYWRGHFRSIFLAKQLEETQRLNAILEERQRAADEKAKYVQPTKEEEGHDDTILFSGTTKESIELQLNDFLYAEAVGNYVKIEYVKEGKVMSQMLRTTIKQLVEDLMPYPSIQRCHRAFVINVCLIDHVENPSGSFQLVMKHCLTAIPVSKSYLTQIKEIIRHPENLQKNRILQNHDFVTKTGLNG